MKVRSSTRAISASLLSLFIFFEISHAQVVWPTMAPAPQPTQTSAPSATMAPTPQPTQTSAPSATMAPAPQPTQTSAPSATMAPTPQPTQTGTPPPATMAPTPQPTQTGAPPVTMKKCCVGLATVHADPNIPFQSMCEQVLTDAQKIGLCDLIYDANGDAPGRCVGINENKCIIPPGLGDWAKAKKCEILNFIGDHHGYPGHLPRYEELIRFCYGIEDENGDKFVKGVRVKTIACSIAPNEAVLNQMIEGIAKSIPCGRWGYVSFSTQINWVNPNGSCTWDEPGGIDNPAILHTKLFANPDCNGNGRPDDPIVCGTFCKEVVGKPCNGEGRKGVCALEFPEDPINKVKLYRVICKGGKWGWDVQASKPQGLTSSSEPSNLEGAFCPEGSIDPYSIPSADANASLPDYLDDSRTAIDSDLAEEHAKIKARQKKLLRRIQRLSKKDPLDRKKIRKLRKLLRSLIPED